MIRELKDFISDWQIDLNEKSAVHKSGLKIGYDSTNPDGSLRLAYSGMTSFMKNTYAELKDVAAVEKRRDDLAREFEEIFKQKMIP